MRRISTFSRCSIVIAACLLLAAPVSAASAGELNGVVRDPSGNPLANLLVALISTGTQQAIPFLTRTDEAGRLLFSNIQPGTYQLLVKSSAWESPGRLVEIAPGKTSSVILVLQQLFSLGPADQQNVGIKTLLRTSSDGRMIFRTSPDAAGLEEDANPFFEKAVVEVSTDSGLGDPTFSPGGTTTNFAVKHSLIGGNDYVVAGQFNSGPESLWRVKNLFDHRLGENHSVQFFMGYGRINFGDSDRPSLDNPAGSDPIAALNSTRIVSLGFEDTLRLGEALSVLFGLEFNQVRRRHTRSFLSPNAEIAFTPLDGTTFRATMSSKRKTRSNLVTLPGEDSVNLSDAVLFSVIDDDLSLSTARYYEAIFSQALGGNTSVELAAFRNQLSGAALPYYPLNDTGRINAFRLNETQASGQGYRVTLRRQLGDNFKASVSYVRGEATGLEDADSTLLVDPVDLSRLLRRRGFHALATQVDAFVPASQTHVTAILKQVGKGQPLTSLDALSDVHDTANKGFNLFIRQLIPVPTSLLNFLGLEFLAAYRIEALLDIRNLGNEDLGVLRGADGSLLLVQNPRTVRGGIALNF